MVSVNKHFKKEVEHFFKVYKDLENKTVTTNGFGNKAAAVQMIKECKERFDNLENKKEGLFSILNKKTINKHL
ncbi:inorganic diphosphatase [Myroides indicus]|uniref:inorganic diphosphatase n=1 Tax=Myroides indicus TaxID=1323422 RepID=UPI001FB89D79|nr:inorganic diphosphatase [Myroides indicus]